MMNAEMAWQETMKVREKKNSEIMRQVEAAVSDAIEHGMFNTYPIDVGTDPIDVVRQLRGMGYTVKYNATSLELGWQGPKER